MGKDAKSDQKKRTPRVLLAKVGLDGHDRGILVIARGLVDAGMEVIYTGRFQKAENVAIAAVQEDADVIGLSILSGAHRTLVPRVMDELNKKGVADIPVVVGGFIPPDDVPFLYEAGVRRVFDSGSKIIDIVNYVRELSRR